MKLKSLIQNRNHLEIADVEIEFIPGIPQIHFLGLPDRIIKESFYRIKSALKNSGYQFPVTSQMIVNIKPSHLRKSSRGVELAVAIGLLLKTQQIPEQMIDPNWIIYGELGLDGKVYEPTDLGSELTYFKEQTFLSGITATTSQQSTNRIFRVTQLSEFEVQIPEASDLQNHFVRPAFALEKFFSKDEAEFLFLTATSQAHALLAGDAGAGKTTLAKSILSFLPPPNENEKGRWYKAWRPLVAPHSSLSPAAFLGGGAHLYEGEVERVQGGVLLMDEFLFFNPEILEALRGPMTGEVLRLARGSENREVESQFQVIATTNLCKCGKWTPAKKNISCRYSRTLCTKTLERLSGPILDRFGILFFTEPAAVRNISGIQILARIEKLRLAGESIQVHEADIVVKNYYANLSTRRKIFLDQLARLYALERAHKSIKKINEVHLTFDDYNQAERWVIKPFEQLEKGMS